MTNKKTLIIGASTNPHRYSYKAIIKLRQHKHDVIAIGKKHGIVVDIEITDQLVSIKDLHTITLYLNPQLQKQYYSYILSLKPTRVIFNPGTENSELEDLLNSENIEYIHACTLVLLSINKY